MPKKIRKYFTQDEL